GRDSVLPGAGRQEDRLRLAVRHPLTGGPGPPHVGEDGVGGGGVAGVARAAGHPGLALARAGAHAVEDGGEGLPHDLGRVVTHRSISPTSTKWFTALLACSAAWLFWLIFCTRRRTRALRWIVSSVHFLFAAMKS